MYGAIIGDIVGSRFEFDNIKIKDFEFFDARCHFTDDTVMTCAIMAALLTECNVPDARLYDAAIYWMQKLGRKYIGAGYGRNFYKWIKSDNPQPYESYGNGAAMRVSPCAWAADNWIDAEENAYLVTIPTHNHKEGILGAKTISTMVYLARDPDSFTDMASLRYYAEKTYSLDFTLDEIRLTYKFNETCQGSVPQAIECFLESTSFEDCIRNAISIGGDSDTIAAIAGSIAEAYYGVPDWMIGEARAKLDPYLCQIIDKFDKQFIIT